MKYKLNKLHKQPGKKKVSTVIKRRKLPSLEQLSYIRNSTPKDAEKAANRDELIQVIIAANNKKIDVEERRAMKKYGIKKASKTSIKELYDNGRTMESLASEYNMSVDEIKKLCFKKKAL